MSLSRIFGSEHASLLNMVFIFTIMNSLINNDVSTNTYAKSSCLESQIRKNMLEIFLDVVSIRVSQMR